jgi:sortase B
MQIAKKLSVLLLTMVLLVQLFAGCNKREEEPSSTSATEGTTASETEKPTEEETEAEGEPISEITPELTAKVTEAFAFNDDTVGWLQIPGTNIDDSVVCKFDDETNRYYERLGYDEQFSFNAVYWADFKSRFGDGSREELGVNTCLYGHAMTDEKDHDSYDIKFGNLHNFRDEQFAREHPYIFFSTEKEDMAFEIIAVFVSNADNTNLAYNANPEDGAEFVKMIEEEVYPRSKYDYNVELSDDDKFVTLSACIYTLDNGYVTGYPNTYYRYVIMARLVDADAPLKERADISMNPNVLIDPDGVWPRA